MGKNDEFSYRQFTIQQSHAAMKVGTDSDLLGTLSAAGNKILDIGTGTGVIALMLAQRGPEAHITAIEIDGQAVIDARANFSASPWAGRFTLLHRSFQEFLQTSDSEQFDCIVCNPPYFDKSLECRNESKTKARHTSSLPFPILIEGAYGLLKDDGVFSVIIPPEVLEDFSATCLIKGFRLQAIYRVKTVPEKAPRRYVLVHRKGQVDEVKDETFCLRNQDRSRSDWYIKQLSDFHGHK